jgi:AraC-like DNA-binding protein
MTRPSFDQVPRKPGSIINLARSATLSGFAEVARDLGLDPLGLADEVGLPAESLTNPDLRVPSVSVLRLFNLAAARAGIDDFGLRVARTRRYSNLGVIGLIMREQPTLRHALQALSANIWVQAEGLVVTLEEIGTLGILDVSITHHGLPTVRQSIETALALLVSTLRRFLGAGWVPEMVLMSHGRPASLALHVTSFGCTPLFGQDRDALVLRVADLATPLPEADERSAAELSHYLEFVAGRRSPGLADKVQVIIGMFLPRGLARADHVARHLGMDRRTLHRRLQQQGTSFSDLLQQERRELAHVHIDAGEHSMTEIAELLGFSCLSAFSRWKAVSLGRAAQRAATL